MTLSDNAGLAVTGATHAALDHLHKALHQLRCYIGDPVATVDAALDASPEMPMGHVLRAWLHLLGTEPDALPAARESHRLALALPLNAREKSHVAAIGKLLEGRWREAGRVLEDLSIEWPRDALALQAGHQIDFFTGDARMLHDRIARALPAWSPDLPGFHAVLGMLAFGLEETGQYARAEALGRRSVELEPRDGWGQHAVAHVLEMQDRRVEGVAWMRDHAADWSDDSFFAVHNWWHLALFHLGLDQIDEVLDLLDGPITGHRSSVVLDLIDASALMWRLKLRGVDLGERWHALAERWVPQAGAGYYAFNDMHAMMAFVCSGRAQAATAAATLAQAQTRALAGGGDNVLFLQEVGQAATAAMQAFGEGEHARVVELLRPVRSQAHRFGGSHAQRDLLELTLIEAARRSSQQALWQALRKARSSARGGGAPAGG